AEGRGAFPEALRPVREVRVEAGGRGLGRARAERGLLRLRLRDGRRVPAAARGACVRRARRAADRASARGGLRGRGRATLGRLIRADGVELPAGGAGARVPAALRAGVDRLPRAAGDGSLPRVAHRRRRVALRVQGFETEEKGKWLMVNSEWFERRPSRAAIAQP